MLSHFIMNFQCSSSGSESENSDIEYVICDRCCKPVHEDYIEKCATCGIEICYKCLTYTERITHINRTQTDAAGFTCGDECYADYKEK